jgi:Mg-chelatase subunit ChlD
MPSFTADVYQNEYLPVGGAEVNAIITVASAGMDAAVRPPDAAEIVIVDTSGSMDVPHSKMGAARDATAVAIDCIRDGVALAVIAGTTVAHLVYPPNGGLALAGPERRAEAKRAASKLRAGGGTAIGTWLTLARRLFESVPDRVCHAILLTDGENRHETPEQLDAVLAECDGRFQCDCRGVGTDWQVSELRRTR